MTGIFCDFSDPNGFIEYQDNGHNGTIQAQELIVHK